VFWRLLLAAAVVLLAVALHPSQQPLLLFEPPKKKIKKKKYKELLFKGFGKKLHDLLISLIEEREKNLRYFLKINCNASM